MVTKTLNVHLPAEAAAYYYPVTSPSTLARRKRSMMQVPTPHTSPSTCAKCASRRMTNATQ